jgi:hypothetical protein
MRNESPQRLSLAITYHTPKIMTRLQHDAALKNARASRAFRCNYKGASMAVFLKSVPSLELVIVHLDIPRGFC